MGKTRIFLAGEVETFLSLFIGSTGPLVTGFIKQIHYGRIRTVATFATAMTLQQAPKALIFAAAGFILHEWLWFIAARSPAARLGPR